MWKRQILGMAFLVLVATGLVNRTSAAPSTLPLAAGEEASQSQPLEPATVNPEPTERTRAKGCYEQCTSDGLSPEECDLECNWVADLGSATTG